MINTPFETKELREREARRGETGCVCVLCVSLLRIRGQAFRNASFSIIVRPEGSSLFSDVFIDHLRCADTHNTKRVREIEGAIAGLMEEVAEVKCELVLG